MAKKIEDVFIDAMLDKIATCTLLSVCSAEPANKAAVAGVTLASVALTAGDGLGDYVIANGDTSGRKVTVSQQASISIAASGSATHIVLDDGVNIVVTTCTSQALTIGGTVTVPAFDDEVADPA